MSLVLFENKVSFVQRFTGRGAAYSAGRPNYPTQILEILNTEIGFDRTKIVADIGSGTGLLSKLFLQNGNHVFGVEPNRDMRSYAEQALAKIPKFVSIDGTAEQTTLRDSSIDLVTVGQALHWFDPVKAPKEFSRISRSNGHLCIVNNDRSKQDSFMKAYDELIQKYARDRAKVVEITKEYLSRFFRNGKYSRFQLSNEQYLDFQGLLHRMTSASYMPSLAEPERFSSLENDAQILFKSYVNSGRVRLVYDCLIFLGSI